MKILIPTFKDLSERNAYLREKKNAMIAMKKSAIKHSDGINSAFITKENDIISVEKGINTEKVTPETNKIYIEPVISTTMIMDSHDDVHIDGLFNRSVKSERIRILNREHKGNDFEYIISDEVEPKIQRLDWSLLNTNYSGQTEVLIYATNVEKQRNEFMFNQYVKGWVKQHSVEMIYVQLFFAINSSDRRDKAEKDIWEQYINSIVNRDEVEEQGYFFAVTEAKEVGGAAVPRGSNFATPNTMLIDSSDKNIVDPLGSTQQQNTVNPIQSLNWELIANALKQN